MLPPGTISSSKYTKMCVLPGLCPGPHWGKLQNSPDLLAGFQGAASRQGREGKRGRRKRKRKREGDSIPPLLFTT